MNFNILCNPLKRISAAARIAAPGDEIPVAPGIYREYVDPQMREKKMPELRIAVECPLEQSSLVQRKLKTGSTIKAMCGDAKLKTASLEITIHTQPMLRGTGILRLSFVTPVWCI